MKYMRYFIGLVFCFLLLSVQAHACRGASQENSLFFEAIPDLQADAVVIAKVSLSDVNDGTAMATVMLLLKSSDARLRRGDSLVMKFEFSSCGPNHRNGEEGTIIARVREDNEGRLMLYPYLRRYSDGRITLPSI